MLNSWEERRTSGAHFASDSDSISRLGTEPHSRTSSFSGEVEEAVVVTMIGYYIVAMVLFC